jgi:competence protein ComEC
MSRIKQWVQAQRGQGLAWLVLAYAAGIATYYALPHEPVRPGLLLLAAIPAVLLLAHRRARPFWLAALAFAVGLAWASHYTAQQTPVMLKRELTPRPLTGMVEAIERIERGLRFTLGAVEIRGVDAAKTPRHVRLSMRLRPGDAPALPMIGSRISLLAGLLPPMGAATPGGFDFARYFYFRDIGAVGYVLPPWKTLADAPERGLHARFQQWRLQLTEQIIATLGPTNGPIAAGLITGEARAIRAVDYDALKAANLYHIIAISGGHMVVIAGVIFIGLRLLCLLVPGGQRPGAKAIAAALTLLMVTLYLFITGLPISAVRAYVMIALMLLAVILRREVDAMRSLMLAALLMLIADPSDLLEPGFQLSFVATLAIIALAQAAWLRPPAVDAPSLAHRAWQAVLAALLIALAAESATSLLVVRMFNQFAPYGVLANALATPLVALLLMPAVALYFVLLPLGLQGWALALLGHGIDAMLWIAHTVADLPHALIFLPAPPDWALGIFVLGLCVIGLVRGGGRWLGLGLCALAWASIATVQMPDLLIGPQAKQIALRTPDGYALVRGRPDSLVPELWANALGYKNLPALRPGTPAWRCDRMGCIATVGARHIAFPTDAVALLEDCRRNDWVVSPLRTRHCDAPMIRPWALEHAGVHVYWAGENRWETGAGWQGKRPWSIGGRD